jgi:gluconolactonase
MKCDLFGNIWVTAPGGLWVFAPNGELLGKVRIPELASNLNWGGPDFRTLFVTATHSVYHVRTKAGPRVEPYMRSRGPTAQPAGQVAPPPPSQVPQNMPPPPPSQTGGPMRNGSFQLDARRCALIVQDMQNDVMIEGGAFASTGSPVHARQQNVVANSRRLMDACRARGVAIIHVWFVVGPGAPGLTLNCPLFEGLADAKALIRGTWGAQPAQGLEPQPGDFVVEKMRMSAWEGSNLETILKGTGRDVIINTGAWTNMSVEHTARTAADKGYYVVLPEDACSTMNAEWHNASINFALTNVAVVTKVDDVIAALG